MIKINKSPCPEILQENSEVWTKELLKKKENGEGVNTIQNRYKHEDIKNTLKKECFNKCIYCESKINHDQFGDIEHILPKSRFPELTFDWENLGFVCIKCNNAKRDYYDEELKIVNPYIEDPKDFFMAMGQRIENVLGNDRGFVSLEKLRLNRPELEEKRKLKLDSLQKSLEYFAKVKNLSHKQILLQSIYESVAEDQEYSFVASTFVNQKLNNP